MKLDERKRREKAKFKTVHSQFEGYFGGISQKVLEEAATIAGIDLRNWHLDVTVEEFANAYVDHKSKKIAVGKGISKLTRPMRNFILLHELGHVRQYNSGDLDPSAPYPYVRWQKRLMIPRASSEKAYAALPWERDASDFAMASPLFLKVEPKDIESVEVKLRETLRAHLKMKTKDEIE